MALIDRQTLIDSFCSQCAVDKPETCSTIRYGDKWCNEVYTILNAPTVDAVPVVRCKDCRYWDVSPASTAAPAYHECKARASRIGRVHTTADEFCSRRERKDGDGIDNDMDLHV